MVRVEREDVDLVHAFLWLVRNLSQEEAELLRFEGERLVAQQTVSKWRRGAFKSINARTRRGLRDYVERERGGVTVPALARRWREEIAGGSDSKGRGYRLTERLSEAANEVPLKQLIRDGLDEALEGGFDADEIRPFFDWATDAIQEAVTDGNWHPQNS